MENYEKILAMWRTHKLEVAADIDRALDNFKTSFAFQSGRLTNPQITYHDTVSIFEKDSVGRADKQRADSRPTVKANAGRTGPAAETA